MITLDKVSLAFGHLPLLDGVSLSIEEGERIAVLGRNGEGKSTLLKVLSGELAPDGGVVWRAPSTRVARLAQDADALGDASGLTVFDAVAAGLGDLRDLVRDYHHTASEVAHHATDAAIARLGELQHDLEQRDGWRIEQRIETVLERLGLDADAAVSTLSGGWRRRVLLAQALVSQPTLLLLDEPASGLRAAERDRLSVLIGQLHVDGLTMLLVEHDVGFVMRLVDRVTVLDLGTVIASGTAAEVRADPKVVAAYLGTSEVTT